MPESQTDEDLPANSPEGVDLTLIRLPHPLEERLRTIQDAANSIERMKELMTDA